MTATEKYPGPPATSMTQKLSFTVKGTYTTDASTLKFINKDVKKDVDVMLEPKEVWAEQIEGSMTVEDLEADLKAEAQITTKQEAASFVFKDGVEYTWDVTGDTLSLTHSNQKMLLKKK